MSREAMKARLNAASIKWGKWAVEDDDGYGYKVYIQEPGFGTMYIAEDFNQGGDSGLSDATMVAHAPEDLQKLHAALDAIEALPHEDYCCTKGCPGFGLAMCGKVDAENIHCDGSECSCFMSGPLRAIKEALGDDA